MRRVVSECEVPVYSGETLRRPLSTNRVKFSHQLPVTTTEVVSSGRETSLSRLPFVSSTQGREWSYTPLVNSESFK